ncbi:hypothetical protein T484DRAFT_1836277 [Baffinella frigidus]|nr:hypothetical protein T484DRAFT_1836277 [Cryptophyta sp. CCMP2293]
MQKNGLFQKHVFGPLCLEVEVQGADPKLAKHVFGPLCLEVEVQGADPKLAVYVDAMLGKDGSAFLVLCQHDQVVITNSKNAAAKPPCQHDQDVITNSKNAAVKSINMFNFDKRRPAGGPAPVRPSKQVLEHYGIQGYLIDFVHAPEQVMEFLRNGSGLDKVPIGTETSFNLREEMAHDARLKTTNHDNKFSNTLAGNWIFTPARRFIITYSFYGDKHPIFSDKAYFYQDRCKHPIFSDKAYYYQDRCKVALGRPAAEIQNLRDILDKKTAEEQTLSERVPPLQEEARRLRALFDESQAVWKALTDEKHQGKVAPISTA